MGYNKQITSSSALSGPLYERQWREHGAQVTSYHGWDHWRQMRQQGQSPQPTARNDKDDEKHRIESNKTKALVDTDLREEQRATRIHDETEDTGAIL